MNYAIQKRHLDIYRLVTVRVVSLKVSSLFFHVNWPCCWGTGKFIDSKSITVSKI